MSAPPQIEYRRLGKSGLRVSVPILGCMSFGTDKYAPWIVNEEEGLALLEAAWKRGLTTWDVANTYSDGESERIIGKALKQFQIPRHRVTILTKCHFLVKDAGPSQEGVEDEDLRDYVNQSGLSRQAIFNQVAGSLERLGTDYIDLLQIHRCDLENVSAEETMKALHNLVQSGKVRYIGASSMWTWQFAHYNHVAEKNGWTQFVSMQNHYSAAYREEEREMLKYCEFAGIGVIPWAPLFAGRLSRPLAETSARDTGRRQSDGYQDPPKCTEEIIGRVERIARDKGWTMTQVTLAWVNAKVTSPIVGVSSIKRLEEAIIPGWKLSEEEMKSIEEPYQPMTIRGH